MVLNEILPNDTLYREKESFNTTRMIKDMYITGIYDPGIGNENQVYCDEMIIYQKEQSNIGVVYVTLTNHEVAHWE